jgi:hypothetical protein
MMDKVHDAERKAREIVATAQEMLAAIGNPANVNDAGFCGCGDCPQCLLECAHQSIEELIAALREARAEAFKECADIAWIFAGDPVALKVARAIERAATTQEDK